MDQGASKQRPQDRPPRTIGELRRRLDELGNPWTVPEEFADDAPVPQAPHPEPVEPGHVPGLRAIDPDADIDEVIREVEPPNAHLVHQRRAAHPHHHDADDDHPWGVG